MDIEIKVTGTKQALNLWTLAEATADGKTCKIYMVRFDEPSQYGIRRGRISKLDVVADGDAVINYDRGWVNRPKTEADKAVLKAILKKFN